jgi:Ca2+/Na+ antiporter
MLFHSGDGRTQAFVMLMLAAGLLYAAARIATFALARPDGSDAGRRAVAQWVPIAGTALAAVCLNRSDIALAIVLGTSVACLSLAVGMVTWLNPMQALPASRKCWPFILPAALLILMAGFSAHLSWWHAIMLLLLGGAILGLWLDSSETPEPTAAPPEARPPNKQAAIVMVFVTALVILGGILAVRGTLATCSVRDMNNRQIYPGTLAATILSPLLILPTLGTASAVAQRGYTGRAVTALVGTVLLNLCLLLPIAILLWHLTPANWRYDPFRAFNMRWDRFHHLPFDMAAWQIETISLVVLGFAMIPISLGKWTLGRVESSLLVLAYAAYVIMLAEFGVQQT